ncbi:MAG: helix-turn-helix domain-containing protein [Bacteroidales bacterium]|nr:helix-turn-helix domain-containing protein [Bacteroidales bacterium]
MNIVSDIFYGNVLNPSAITNAKDEFIILDNPIFSPSSVYPYKNEWIIATLCEQGYAKGKVNMREYRIEPNCLILILPGQVIGSSELSSDFKGKIILLSSHFVESLQLGSKVLMTQSIERKPYYLFPPEASQAFHDFIALCKSLISINDNPNIIETLQLLVKGFFVGMEGFFAIQQPLPRLISGHTSDLAESFLNMVELEYRRHRDLSYYADRLCRSVKYLSRVIKESTGRSATEWIELCVIMDAKAQLISTKKRISEISDDLDFPSPSFFGKYFKRVTGMSPRKYREQSVKK